MHDARDVVDRDSRARRRDGGGGSGCARRRLLRDRPTGYGGAHEGRTGHRFTARSRPDGEADVRCHRCLELHDGNDGCDRDESARRIDGRRPPSAPTRPTRSHRGSPATPTQAPRPHR
jgi:hypothetical protein